MTRDRTVLIIAHWRSTIRHTDHVIVLEWGKRVDLGIHEQFMRQGDLYRRLYELQFQI